MAPILGCQELQPEKAKAKPHIQQDPPKTLPSTPLRPTPSTTKPPEPKPLRLTRIRHTNTFAQKKEKHVYIYIYIYIYLFNSYLPIYFVFIYLHIHMGMGNPEPWTSEPKTVNQPAASIASSVFTGGKPSGRVQQVGLIGFRV